MIDPAPRVAALLGVPVTAGSRLAGGDVSAVWRLKLEDGTSVVAKMGPLAATEADMLCAIAATGAPAPVVRAVDGELLVLEDCPSEGGLSAAWPSLAAALAKLHAPRQGHYGWAADYAFGPVEICSAPTDDWPAFWADHRLRCHLPHLPRSLGHRIERLAGELGSLLPAQPVPALLHGDLWGGNILAAGGNVTALIDPACTIGDREVDIAMLTLFDAPPASFFDALGLEPGWKQRQPIYRLWPLLVHVRLFGGGYLGQTGAELDSLAF